MSQSRSIWAGESWDRSCDRGRIARDGAAVIVTGMAKRLGERALANDPQGARLASAVGDEWRVRRKAAV
jgi:hypothetical protein